MPHTAISVLKGNQEIYYPSRTAPPISSKTTPTLMSEQPPRPQLGNRLPITALHSGNPNPPPFYKRPSKCRRGQQHPPQ